MSMSADEKKELEELVLSSLAILYAHQKGEYTRSDPWWWPFDEWDEEGRKKITEPSYQFVIDNLLTILQVNKGDMRLVEFFADAEIKLPPLIQLGKLHEYFLSIGDGFRALDQERAGSPVYGGVPFYYFPVEYRPHFAIANFLSVPVKRLDPETIFEVPKEQEDFCRFIEHLRGIEPVNDVRFEADRSYGEFLKTVEWFLPSTLSDQKFIDSMAEVLYHTFHNSDFRSLDTLRKLLKQNALSEQLLNLSNVISQHRPSLLAPLLDAALNIEKEGKPDQRLFTLKDPAHCSASELTVFYETLTRSLLLPRSSLYTESNLNASIELSTRRFGKTVKGIRERISREGDTFYYLFEQMYHVASLPALRWEDPPFLLPEIAGKNQMEPLLNTLQQIVLAHWKTIHQPYVDLDVAQQLSLFDFSSFFADKKVQNFIQQVHQQGKKKRYLFEENPSLLFAALREQKFYPGGKEVSGYVLDFLGKLERSLTLPHNFDEVRIEYNQNKLDTLCTLAGDCLSHGIDPRFELLAINRLGDPHLDTLAANIYREKSFLGTAGKAFLARCRDQHGQEVLYVDGVVMNQDLADMLIGPNKGVAGILLRTTAIEAAWMPLYTKAIIAVAQLRGFQEIIFNTQQSSAQRSIWEYCRHIATLLGLREGKEKDYTYNPNIQQLTTISTEGFEFTEKAAKKNYHYLEKVVDENSPPNSYLAGFWINHWDHTLDQNNPHKKYSPIPAFVPRTHKERPYINDGKGQIIGFLLSTEEWMNRYNQKYAEQFGKITKAAEDGERV